MAVFQIVVLVLLPVSELAVVWVQISRVRRRAGGEGGGCAIRWSGWRRALSRGEAADDIGGVRAFHGEHIETR